MSGHSKWKTIKRQKGVADNKRGQLFTKLTMAISIAIRQGGGVADPAFNFKLRLAIDRARAASMPKENIERAIAKAKGNEGAAMEELLYEGFGPSGVAIIVEAVTDNKQRTVSDVKNAFDKGGGTMGAQGSVSYMFKRKGVIEVKKNGAESDDLLSKGIDAGVEDMEEEGESVFFYTDPQSLQQVRKALEESGTVIESAELTYIPTTYTEQDDSVQEKVLSLIERLEELDDVQQVYTNLA